MTPPHDQPGQDASSPRHDHGAPEVGAHKIPAAHEIPEAHEIPGAYVVPDPAVRLDRHTEARGDRTQLAEWFPTALLLRVDDESRVGQDLGLPTTGSFDDQRHVFLGRVGPQWWFAERGPVTDPVVVRSLEHLEPADRDLIFTALAVLAWHDTEPTCSHCGEPTVRDEGGFARLCLGCGHQEFPRQDPAMIVAVLDPSDRLLLAHHTAWDTNRASLLAGFVEAGESVEDAVVREVAEEVGLQVSAVRYVTSRPWPFPRSLMLGCVARAQGEPRPDGVEIGWARWYSAEELTAALDAGDVTIPSSALAVATSLIEQWRAGNLATLI